MFRSHAHAAAALYLAYFNRPADPEGLEYWVGVLDGGASFFDVAQIFAGTEEATSTYPFLSAGAGNEELFLRSIFSNVYARWPSTEDAGYWGPLLAAGRPGWQVLTELILAASGSDINYIENKIETSLYITNWYADKDENYAAGIARWLLSHAASQGSFEKAVVAIEAHFAPPEPEPEPVEPDPGYDFSGDDTYYVEDTAQTIDERPEGGYDTAISSVSYTLPANVERLILTGTADIDGYGNDEDNEIVGNSGNNILRGRGGDDRLVGGAGHDMLDGGSGADRMEGGAGNDIYYVDNPGDTIIELPGEGTDTVYVSLNTYEVPTNVEIVIFSGGGNFIGTASDMGSEIRGGAWSNTLYGGDGDDRLIGGNGDDTLFGGAGNDELYGSNGVNRLSGGAGADFISLGGTTNILVYSRDDIINGGAGDRITGYISGIDRFEMEVPGLAIGPLTSFTDDRGSELFQGASTGSASPQIICSNWNGSAYVSNNYLWIDFDGSGPDKAYLVANLGNASFVTAGDIWVV